MFNENPQTMIIQEEKKKLSGTDLKNKSWTDNTIQDLSDSPDKS